ncbi:ATP-dependent RecD-like DNA helicase [Photobacterium sp. ZSDE20]|uniref:ATP-dependent RecD-like DNA helicase n=1 Tax=Photobacterium pectinilyticum TaxID=2906793 RepID=A0ABT1N8Y3_9GAMM|nr:AAA family ATPase [Photobacterium sp. ZSDE20]MCQ1061210.1 ATP-dependent RecD-like DNA helicase [Photobacterium sp. ZSDE20]MDD1829579.1 ATP-dependent RecD-like DNA helicase [Photobacterium sp. ZSDE20]
MNTALYEDQMRVTSIPYRTSKLVIFSGVPLAKGSYKTNSGKYYVTIKAHPDSIPVPPTLGQHWSVKGTRQIENMEVGDYVMQQHTYESPEHIECSLPETGEQLIRFIANGAEFKGIGENKAREIWEHLGKGFHSTLKSDTPESRERLRKVLTEGSIDALFKGYAKYKNLSYCNWMTEHKIPANIQQRLLKHHGEESIDAIKHNPYVLMGFGMSFKGVDEMVANPNTSYQIGLDDSRRLSAALEAALRQEVDKGHTYTNQTRLRPYLNKLLKDKALATEAFKSGYNKAQYLLNPETGTYHPTAQLLMESVVAKRLKKLAAQNDLFDEQANSAYCHAAGELPYDLTDKQVEAVMTCLDNAVSCITGGAGTGKTTVLRTALRAYHQMGYEIHAVALSGRAAMRLHESIGFFTSTIARLLKDVPIEPEDNRCKHLLVIDEASMVDLPTMYRLVNHIHPSVRIILTGDPDQLPPIGCGKVLADIVMAKTIANTMLDIVKRQEGSTGIPEYSKLINQGTVPEQLSTGAIVFHETNKDDIAQVCCSLYQQSPENSRVMAPTRALVSDINKLTQSAVNSDGERLEFQINGDKFFMDLRLGDTVLFTQNHYEDGIQNGSLGTLTNVKNLGETYGEVTLDTGDKVEITQPLLDCMELGYAITLHKAQGSQFPRIIVALQAGRIVDRSWIYTAITRAEVEIHIVGSAEAFKTIIEHPSNVHHRNSFLLEILKTA